jgi:hypothetical protein
MLLTSRTTLDFVFFYLTFLFQCASKNTATIALQGSKKTALTLQKLNYNLKFFCFLSTVFFSDFSGCVSARF